MSGGTVDGPGGMGGSGAGTGSGGLTAQADSSRAKNSRLARRHITGEDGSNQQS